MIGSQDVHDALGRADRHCALFHDDFVTGGYVGDHPSRAFHVLQIGGATLAVAERLGRRVHRDEDQLGFFDRLRVDESLFRMSSMSRKMFSSASRSEIRPHLGDIGGEEEILVATLPDDVVEARLVDR